MLRALLICTVVSACAVACTSVPGTQPGARTASAVTPCALTSASRIPPKPGECSISPGRTYSSDDIQRTGQPDVGPALQMLDPSITVHH